MKLRGHKKCNVACESFCSDARLSRNLLWLMQVIRMGVNGLPLSRYATSILNYQETNYEPHLCPLLWLLPFSMLYDLNFHCAYLQGYVCKLCYVTGSIANFWWKMRFIEGCSVFIWLPLIHLDDISLTLCLRNRIWNLYKWFK